MRILDAIHDFLPRHQAGSEIYAFHLCRELAKRHVVHVLAAEYDPGRAHGTLTWRVQGGLPVVELVNTWEGSFADTWQSPRIGAQLAHVLDATEPDVLHVHSLLNLTFDLPAIARARGIPVVATLHDHSLACPAGGQRLHLGDQSVCETIDPGRCASCFPLSAFHAQMAVAAARRIAGPAGEWVGPAAKWLRRRVPGAAAFAARLGQQAVGAGVSGPDIAARLDHLRAVFDSVELFVAPSKSVARAHETLGLPASKLLVSDYGFPHRASRRGGVRPRAEPLRLGFVGTLAWHKGIHVLLEAARALPAGRFELEIWGSPETFPDYSARLTTLARGLPVRFCGAFDNCDAAAVYDRLDLLVVPSLWPENSPLVIHEAFMAGVPVVASKVGGIPELVADGVTGVLYEPSSSSALAEVLRELLDHPSRIGEMAERVPHVKTIEQDARDWELRYENFVQRSPAPQSRSR